MGVAHSRLLELDTGSQVKFSVAVTIKSSLPKGVVSQILWGNGEGGIGTFGTGVNEPSRLLTAMLKAKGLRPQYDIMRKAINATPGSTMKAVVYGIRAIIQDCKSVFAAKGVRLFYCSKTWGRTSVRHWLEFVDLAICKDKTYTPKKGLRRIPCGCEPSGYSEF
eukprot:TRINITY_DN57037_c0_g1_i1.p1 TRINITY_DN57037_c0_g1~~TRINITY_DN57037_c0_g1_i1.p1  ORF type:complete len:179 (+),score=20.58 TRINITY_DN57037_c0_g1_i1:48-539(+)